MAAITVTDPVACIGPTFQRRDSTEYSANSAPAVRNSASPIGVCRSPCRIAGPAIIASPKMITTAPISRRGRSASPSSSAERNIEVSTIAEGCSTAPCGSGA